MMMINEFVEKADLSGAIHAATAQVKNRPSDLRARTTLFELLCLSDDLERAARHLEAIGSQTTDNPVGIQAYRNTLKALQDRHRVFTHQTEPAFLLEPPAYIELYLKAISEIVADHPEQAQTMLIEAETARPSLSGTLNGTSFLDFRDADDWTGGFLEIIARDAYAWLPFEQIRQLTVEPVRYLRDVLFTPATIETLDDTLAEVFVFGIYEKTRHHPDGKTKLGHITDWVQTEDGLYHGVGQRLFQVDDEDIGWLEIKTLCFETPPTVTVS